MKVIIYLSCDFFNVWSIDKKNNMTCETVDVSLSDFESFCASVKKYNGNEVLILISAKLYYNISVKLPFAQKEAVLKILPNLIIAEHFEKDKNQKFDYIVYSISSDNNDTHSALVSYMPAHIISNLRFAFHNAKLKLITSAHLFIYEFARGKNIPADSIFRIEKDMIDYIFETNGNTEITGVRTLLKNEMTQDSRETETGKNENIINFNELLDKASSADFSEFLKNSAKYPKICFYRMYAFNSAAMLKKYFNRNTVLLCALLLCALAFYSYSILRNAKTENEKLNIYLGDLLKKNFPDLKIIVNPQAQTRKELEKALARHNTIIKNTPVYIDYKNILNKIFLVFEKTA